VQFFKSLIKQIGFYHMKRNYFSILPFLTGILILSGISMNTASFHTTQHDGPYVFYRNNKIQIRNIVNDHGMLRVSADSTELEKKSTLSFNVATDMPEKSFPVILKKELEVEKSEFGKVSKLFVISDIEGNFAAFRKLLQGNKVIDNELRWSYGNGHLVLTGDFFDRGSQVTEVLWLIYSLEEQAKAAGGHVHFILGNHEIMNLNNDLRYVHSKYFQSAVLMNESYLKLYSEETELGRWLRTKNVTEKIGDFLFVHGGFSSLVNSLDLSVPRLNKLVRPFYADTAYDYKDLKVEILYSDLGPFWYRGYYLTPPASIQSQIDSTLRQHKVKHIATGHTIVADTISVLYNGKVFNTDVQHYKGHSEALLVEDGKYYRVNATGEKLEFEL
jgi:hypothetical protein